MKAYKDMFAMSEIDSLIRYIGAMKSENKRSMT